MPDLNRDAAIALAKEGKDAWNAWAQQNPGAKISFTNMGKMSVEGSLPSLAGFIFPGEADFSGSILTSGPELAGATFKGPAFFRLVEFKFQPNFQGAEFYKIADFHGASFVHGPVDFSRAKFMDGFSISVNANERGDKPIPEVHNPIPGILFKGCEFYKMADFSNRIFGGAANFQSATFHGLPVFHGASLHPGTIFGDIAESFTDFRSPGAEQCYRTLKRAMRQQQADNEADAFAELESKFRSSPSSS